jgi:hypothetical protein
MELPRAARVALYVGITVVDLNTGLPVVLDWEISLDDGVTWITGTRVTITEPNGAHEVIRFLIAGPDAPNDAPADVTVTATADVKVRAVDGDEILVLEQYISPVTVI